jgi:hypothetical protein
MLTRIVTLPIGSRRRENGTAVRDPVFHVVAGSSSLAEANSPDLPARQLAFNAKHSIHLLHVKHLRSNEYGQGTGGIIDHREADQLGTNSKRPIHLLHGEHLLALLEIAVAESLEPPARIVSPFRDTNSVSTPTDLQVANAIELANSRM